MIVFIAGLRSNRVVASILRTYMGFTGISTIVFTGNTVSPTIVEDFAKLGFRVAGIAGNLDNPTVIRVLKSHEGFLESRVIELGGFRVVGAGLQVRQVLENAHRLSSVDILVTHYPGVRYSCGEMYGYELVDKLIKALNPRLVVIGRSDHQYLSGGVVCPGPGYRGYIAVIRSVEGGISVTLTNIYDWFLGVSRTS